MGCFAGTCCLSNTAIFENDAVILVTFNQPLNENSFYYLNDKICAINRKNKQANQEQFKQVDEAMLDAGFEYADLYPIKDILIGTYNDGGWIKEVELSQKDKKARILNNHQLYHKWAVEHLLGRKIDKITDNYQFLTDLYVAMYRLRKSPMDSHLLGLQHDGIEEMQLQIKMNEASNKFLAERIKKFMD